MINADEIKELLYEYSDFDNDEEERIINSLIKVLKISTIEQLKELNTTTFYFEKTFFNSGPFDEDFIDNLVDEFTDILLSENENNNNDNNNIDTITYKSIPVWNRYLDKK